VKVMEETIWDLGEIDAQAEEFEVLKHKVY
jgi:hypothetical protein